MELQHRHWRSSKIIKKINTDNSHLALSDMDTLNIPIIWQGGKSEETQKKITVLGFNGIRQYTIKETIKMLKEGQIFNNNRTDNKKNIDKPIAKEVYENE